MKTFWLLFVTFLGTQSFAQVLNQKTMDTKKPHEILIGYCDREGFTTCDFDSAYRANYGPYAPDTAVMRMLSPAAGDITVTLIMGTWCDDSKEQVPRFYKILDMLQFDYSKLSLICVDRKKSAPDIDLAGMNIKLVPTFIFYRNYKEIGRITETPARSLEKDMLGIMTKPIEN